MAQTDPKIIHGRITRKDNSAGVHGLSITVWCGPSSNPARLGTVLTRRDGSFAICAPCNLCAHAGPCDIHLVIHDCTGRKIHDTREECTTCSPGRSDECEVVLVPDVLWWHLNCCESWCCPTGPLVPRRMIDEIEEAHADLVRRDSQRAFDLSACLARAIPVVGLFDRVLDDACATLQGDLAAGQRFRDVLQVLCADRRSGCCCGSDDVLSALLQPAGPAEAIALPALDTAVVVAEPAAAPDAGTEDGTESAQCSCCDTEAPSLAPCPCAPEIIDREAMLAALLAALHISCGHEETARAYLGALLDQFCRLEFLGALHRAAVAASCGDQVAQVHFRDLVEVLRRDCQTPCCCETCLDARLADCLREAMAVWAELRCYKVRRVEPARACPGVRITICGEGFGCLPGLVAFEPLQGVGEPVQVTPERWCDDRIDVIVPSGAGCGLDLVLPQQTIKICNRLIDLRPTGCILSGFEGTSAQILKFTVKGLADGACLEPGQPLRIRWKTCAADRVRIEIRNRRTGAVLAQRDPAEARGAWDFLDTQFTETTEIDVRITVQGRCKPPSSSREIGFVFQNPPDLSVDGLEITQAIQHYRAAAHLTDPADRGPDNSLRLVTDKTAWVRVYLRSGQAPWFDGGTLPGVTGTLRVERRTGGVWSQIAVLNPQNGPVTAQDAFVNYAAERGDISATLNFVVPAALMTGLLRFSAEVASPYPQCPGNSAAGATLADVNLTQTLNAAFITIGYQGPNDDNSDTLSLPAPSLAQCQSETSWAMTTFPVSGQPNVRIAASFTTNTPLNDPRSCPGCCSPNWQPLLQTVAALVALDQLAFPGGNWVYYGLVNNGIPVTVPGCNGWGGTGGLAGRPVTYAHEIGHQFGLPHARCGNAGTGNAAYPVYEPYDLPVDVPANPVSNTNWTMASIGEFGLDINTGVIANPATAEDFMSYCSPRWISRFTHNYLVNWPQLSPSTIATGVDGGALREIVDDEPNFAEPDGIRPLIDIFAVLTGDTVEVTSVSRLETRALSHGGAATAFTAELIDEDGGLIAADTAYAFGSEGGCGGAGHGYSSKGGGGDCGCGCGGDDRLDPKRPVLLRAMVPDVAPGAGLRLRDRDGEIVWKRKRPARAPKLTRVEASYDGKSGEIALRWKASVDAKAKDHAFVALRWSADDGKTWRALQTGLTEESAQIDPANLPGGAIRFEIRLSDGFDTVVAQTDAVELPQRPPSVAILHPADGGSVPRDRLMHLRATLDAPGGAPQDGAALVWSIDGKEVGKGADLWVETPETGRHKVTVKTGKGDLAAEASHVFTVK